MSIAYTAASLVMASKRPPLKDFLVPETTAPKRRKSWQEIKAAIVLALGPGQPGSSVSVPSSSGAESAGGSPSPGGNTRSKQ